MYSANSTHCSHQPSFLPSLLFLSVHYPPTHQHRSRHTSCTFFFSNPQTSCIMKGISACALHVATSNVIANGECATEQRHQQRSDSPLVKTSSLLFLPTSLFCHLSTLRLMETLTLLLWSLCSNGYSWAHFTGTQARSANIDETDQSAMMWLCVSDRARQTIWSAPQTNVSLNWQSILTPRTGTEGQYLSDHHV